MALFKPNTWFKKNEEQDPEVNEALKSFRNRSKSQDTAGEGYEDIGDAQGFGQIGVSSFSSFYDNYINKIYQSEIARIQNYREMAQMPEIADVIEDASIESTQENTEGNVLTLDIIDEELKKNDNIVKTLQEEFDDLFINRSNLPDRLYNIMSALLTDGRVYMENVINKGKPKNGIINLKLLPAESMDYDIDPETGKIEAFYQYLSNNAKKPKNIEEAEEDDKVIGFYPSQITFINSGTFGATKKNIIGYLEKARQPYNQLKLLETAVVIYRLVRAPERLVFRIDTGNMPKDKAMKYVEKIKRKFNQKQTYDPNTGQINNSNSLMCIRKDTEIPLLDGRYLKLEDVINEHEKGKENWVYTVNQDTGKIEPGKIEEAAITRKNENLARVWLDDGNYIDTTLDHKFIMRDGSKKRADELKKDDSLMPLYRKENKLSNNYYDKIKNPNDKWEFTHTNVSNFILGEKNQNEITHHIDFNPKNNNPTNLMRMDYIEHGKYHLMHIKSLWEENYEKMYKAVLKGRETLINDPEKYNKMIENCKWKDSEDYEYRRKRIQEGIDEWNSYEKNKLRKSEWVKRTNIEQNKVKNLLEGRFRPEVIEKQKDSAKKAMNERFKDEKEREKMSQLMSERMQDAELYNKAVESGKRERSDDERKNMSNAIKINYQDKDYLKEYIGDQSQKRWEDPNYRKFMQDIQKANIDDKCVDLVKMEIIRNGFPSKKKILDYLSENKKILNYWWKINKEQGLNNLSLKSNFPKSILEKIAKKDGYNSYTQLRNDLKNNLTNHKVKNIEFIDEKDDTGCITVSNNHNFAVSRNGKSLVFISNSILDNYFLAQSADGRGSQIDTVGGQGAQAFLEMHDIHYFQRKLYRALKYPMSRVSQMHEKQESDILFGGGRMGEITRDEIKWAKFLERQQNKITNALLNVFLLHLEFKGLKKQYELAASKLNVKMTPPNHYKDEINQMVLQSKMDNYQNLAANEEFPKTFLMAKYLGYTDEDFKEMAEYFKKDDELLPQDEDMGF